jgi:hypothetical protein
LDQPKVTDSEAVRVLFDFYKEQVENARHHEIQRERVTSLILLLAAGLVSASGIIGTNHDQQFMKFVACSLIVLGLFGAIFCLKSYERNRRHVFSAREYRKAISKFVSQIDLERLRSNGYQRSDDEYPVVSEIRLHHLWIGFMLLIATFGVAIFFVAR